MNKKAIKYFMLYFIIILITAVNIIILIRNINYSKEQTMDNNSYAVSNEQKKLVDNGLAEKQENINNNDIDFDKEYKLFYGEWKITKIAGSHLTLPMDVNKAEESIGHIVKFTSEKVIYNDEVKLNMPRYDYVVLPVAENEGYIEKMPTLGDIGIKGEYYAYIFVRPHNNKYKPLFIGSEFYIKDNNTLIAHWYGIYYELTRISYIEDAEYKKTRI